MYPLSISTHTAIDDTVTHWHTRMHAQFLVDVLSAQLKVLRKAWGRGGAATDDARIIHAFKNQPAPLMPLVVDVSEQLA